MSRASRQFRATRKTEIETEIRSRQNRIPVPLPPLGDVNYLLTRGWVSFRDRWIDGELFSEEAFFAPDMSLEAALRIQRKRDEEAVLNSLEGQRSKLLGLLSIRKRGPIPLEQVRAGFLFLLERRAIALIESS